MKTFYILAIPALAFTLNMNAHFIHGDNLFLKK